MPRSHQQGQEDSTPGHLPACHCGAANHHSATAYQFITTPAARRGQMTCILGPREKGPPLRQRQPPVHMDLGSKKNKKYWHRHSRHSGKRRSWSFPALGPSQLTPAIRAPPATATATAPQHSWLTHPQLTPATQPAGQPVCVTIAHPAHPPIRAPPLLLLLLPLLQLLWLLQPLSTPATPPHRSPPPLRTGAAS